MKFYQFKCGTGDYLHNDKEILLMRLFDNDRIEYYDKPTEHWNYWAHQDLISNVTKDRLEPIREEDLFIALLDCI